MASEHGMTIEARSATYADAGMGGTAPKTKKPAAVKRATGKAGKGAPLRTIDLFCGAGGITVGTGQACGIANKFARYAATQTLSARPMK